MKAFFTSKTIWTQIVGFIAMFAAMFGFDISPEDQAAVATGIMGAVNVVGIVVRYMTKEPMSAKV